MAAKIETQAWPWYKSEIGPRLKPRTRKLFETYSKIAPDHVESHLHAIRDRAWSVQKYPCIGQWMFLINRTPNLPYYKDIITLLKAGASILDVGCCFGQDLRYMAADGAPTQQMYASDIVPEFWDLGFDLYLDAHSMKAHFLKADILEANILDPASPYAQLSGKIDIVLVNQVFHLFDWERQLKAAKNMVCLSRPGTWVVGYQIGSVVAGARRVKTTTGGPSGAAGSKSRFFHNPETWQDLWRLVGKETRTEWMIESRIIELKEWGLEDEDSAWMGPTAMGLEFIIRRVNNPTSKL